VKPPLVIVGLRAEARIVEGPDVRVLIGGGDGMRLAQAIDMALQDSASGVMSFGLAGGLAPGLRAGATVIASSVVAGADKFMTDETWVRSLAEVLPEAIVADIAGADGPVATARAKRALRAATGAVTVDMESHIAALAAMRHRLPFACLRAVADPFDCDLPPAALVAMGADGAIEVTAVLRSLLLDPRQLPALMRTAVNARAAFNALRLARRNLGTRLALR
jgi:adenosylhomocysteine nucleosidase